MQKQAPNVLTKLISESLALRGSHLTGNAVGTHIPLVAIERDRFFFQHQELFTHKDLKLLMQITMIMIKLVKFSNYWIFQLAEASYIILISFLSLLELLTKIRV